MKSPGVSRLRQPAASALGWVVAGVLAIMLVFSGSSALSRPAAVQVGTAHRSPRNGGDSQLDNDGRAKQYDAKTRRVFVVGCGHSGTSLLLRSIGNMPGVRCIQRETALFHKNTEGDERLQNVLSDWDRIAKRGNFSTWVEKTPRHVYHIAKMFEMETVPGNTRVIFIHRDGRDVALSFKARGYSWDKSVARWVDDNRAAVPFLDRPEVLSVGFEELTTAGSVLPMLRRVADFLGLQVTDGQLVVALVPGTQPHDYQEYCSAYRNDAEKAADLAASLVAVIAGKGANLFEGQSEGQDGVPSSGETLTGSKLEQHNAFRTWQMSQAWAEVPKVQRREWSAEEERQFYDNEAAMELMRRFGYIAERDDGGVR